MLLEPLTDYSIIYEMRLCAVLSALMYIPSTEMQQVDECACMLGPLRYSLSRYSSPSVEQRSLTDAAIEKRERTRRRQIAAKIHSSA